MSQAKEMVWILTSWQKNKPTGYYTNRFTLPIIQFVKLIVSVIYNLALSNTFYRMQFDISSCANRF